MASKIVMAFAAALVFAGTARAGDEVRAREQTQAQAEDGSGVAVKEQTRARVRETLQERAAPAEGAGGAAVKAQERSRVRAATAGEAERAALRHAERSATRTMSGDGAAVRAGRGPSDAARAAETVRSGEMRGAAPASPGAIR